LASDVMIEARGLTKRYGAFRALDKVSFEVKRGEVVGFLGPNGAGKSTTMRILTCYLSATGGAAKVHGFDVFDDPLSVREHIGYLPQRAQMYGEMTVWDYLVFVSELRRVDKSTFRKRMKDIVDICGLSQALGKDIRQLSHGFRQRVGLAQALLHNPPILILDEPTSDLDPNERAEVIDYIKEIGKDRTVILSTHNLSEVEAACARAIIISKGRVVADGPLDHVRARGGRVRYPVTIDEQRTLYGGDNFREATGQPPTLAEVEEALSRLDGVLGIDELPTDESTHAFAIKGTKTTDLRADIFRLCVDKGWLLLGMTREVQKLEDVFKTLTRGEEAAHRGRAIHEDLDDEDLDEDDEDLDDEEGLEGDDEDEDDSGEDDSGEDDSDEDSVEDDEDLDDEDSAEDEKKE
jgi:ABC-2 type transport system ATP-binding protein